MEYYEDKTAINQILGAQIRRLREEKGLSQEELAFRSGISVSTLGRVERGVLSLAINKIPALAKTLEVKAGQFFEPFEEEC